MTLLCALMGVLVGSLLNWASDCLPRFVSSTRNADSPPEPPSRPGVNLQKSPWVDIAVQLATALLFAYLWEHLGPSWRLLSVALTGSFFLLIAIIDLKYRLVPNMLIYPAAAMTLLIRSVPPGRDTLTALLGGAVGLSPFFLVALMRPGDVGGGDIKLAALIGLVLGFPQVLWTLILGILMGGVTAFLLLSTRRWGPRSYIPYAPFLCLGAVFSLVYTPLPLTLPL
jgi:prepilin signal peptidase PulO-like enzyme (type II secretory pathway)